MNRFRQKNKQPEPEKSVPVRPLREFDYGPEEFAPTRRFMPLAGLLALALLLVVVFIAVVFLMNSDDQSEAPVEQVPQFDFSTNSTETNIPELLEGYLDAIGGREALGQIRSVRYQGRLLSGDVEYDFLGLLLLPDKGMLVTNSGQNDEVKLMLNGDTAWQVIERRDGARRVVELGDASKKSLKWSLRVHNSFRRLVLEGRYFDLSVREIDFMDKSCYEVTKSNVDGTKFLAVLDRETLYLLKTQETISTAAGADEFTVVYEDHQEVSGIIEPHRTKLYRNGKLDNEAVVSSYRINPGLVSSLFKIPDELAE